MVKNEKHIRPGYHLTEVGIIPVEWEIQKLGNIGKGLIGLTYKPENVKNFGTLVLRSSNIQNEKLTFKDNVYVDLKIPSEILVKENDILICARNGSRDLIGKSAILTKRYEGLTFGAFMCVYRSPFGEYISHLFHSSIIKRQINQYLGATINQITNGSLNSFIIPLPSKTEQSAIAQVLSDTDALIASLDELIEKKKAIKQGTMQELLTGKRKLPGFSGKWELNTLGDVCVLKNGYAFKSSLYNENGKYKIITIANVQDGFMHSLVTNNIIELPSDIQLHQILVKGEILISMTGNVGRVAQVNNNNLLLNQRVGKLCPLEGMDNKFFYYLCNSRKFLNSMVSKAVGGAQGNIGKSDILEYITNIPKDINEQAAIARILLDIDSEISELEKKRDKYKQIKQGMMSELLTGNIRLLGVK